MGLFGRKKQETVKTVDPSFSQDEFEQGDLVNQAFNQNSFNPSLPSPQLPQMNAQNQGYKPSIMHQQQSFQQPVQQITRFQPKSKIIKGEESQDGEFVYIVVTNYPMGLGDCVLSQ